MSLLAHELELLSPARNVEIAREAIIHGADAVYLGGPEFGARHAAENNVADIAKLTEFAHKFNAKVFIALNTILHDHELESARKLAYELYDAGVDALIIQDMGLLEIDLPPIELHASTQTDIRTLEKAKFMADVGFSQLVLARELSLKEIRAIHEARPDTALEFFVHGALCVAFSGQCYISHAETGRSANRGDCSQACRLPYTLRDEKGRIIAFDKHLLSMKDNNQTNNIGALIEAGVRSFKIEGRYKDLSYVKNITAHYRQVIDAYIEEHPEFQRASVGRVVHHFIPNPDKTFHRGSTDYFVNERKPDIGAFDSPKFVGLPIGHLLDIKQNYLEVKTTEPLANGDGLNIQIKREVVGFRVNRADKIGANHYLVYPNEMPIEFRTERANIQKKHPLNRNHDQLWSQLLAKESATRTVGLTLFLSALPQSEGLQLELTTEHGYYAKVTLSGPFEPARDPDKGLAILEKNLTKLGGTDFELESLQISLDPIPFVPASQINQLRRAGIAMLEKNLLHHYQRGVRRKRVEPPAIFPMEELSFLANVYNQKAREFYYKHGVKLIEPAYEAHQELGEVPVMITKHCLRFSYNLCPKQTIGVTGVQGQVRPTPLILSHEGEEYRLEFNCRACEMHVMGRIKPHILKQPLLGEQIKELT